MLSIIRLALRLGYSRRCLKLITNIRLLLSVDLRTNLPRLMPFACFGLRRFCGGLIKCEKVTFWP